MNMYEYEAVVVRWVDGDTVDLRVDLGFHMWVETRFRLHGINTPERGAPLFKDATQFAEGLAPVGALVRIRTFKGADKYGRWLALVFVSNRHGSSVNEALLGAGLARHYMGNIGTA